MVPKMSLPENANRDRCSDDDASGPSSTKRRKIARACDYCRRKKSGSPSPFSLGVYSDIFLQ